MYKCNPKTTVCKDNATIDAYFNSKNFDLTFVNQYFDWNDFNVPIKKYIDDTLFFQVEANRVKKSNLYVMQAQAQLQDMLFQLG